MLRVSFVDSVTNKFRIIFNFFGNKEKDENIHVTMMIILLFHIFYFEINNLTTLNSMLFLENLHERLLFLLLIVHA